MRVLVSVHAELSHLQPVVPLTWALRSAGHRVLAVLPDFFAPRARRLGLDTASLSFDTDPTAVLQAALSRSGEDAVPVEVWEVPDEEKWARIATRFAASTRAMLPEYLELARRWRPDLVVTDPMENTGRIVAGALGVPWVQHRWGIDGSTGAFDSRLRELLDPDCRELALPGLPSPDLIVDPCPRGIQLANIPAGRPVRYVPVNGAGALPDWALTRPRAPRICVTMGSKLKELGLRRVLGWVIEAVAGLDDAELVLATPGLDPDDYAVVADHVVAAGQVPLGMILDSCSVLVHHGGGGTGLTAACHGVPQLVMPQYLDDFAFAAGTVARNAGIALSMFAEQSDPSRIRTALDELLTSPRYAEGARALAAEMQATPPPAALVPELERLANRGPVPRRLTRARWAVGPVRQTTSLRPAASSRGA